MLTRAVQVADMRASSCPGTSSAGKRAAPERGALRLLQSLLESPDWSMILPCYDPPRHRLHQERSPLDTVGQAPAPRLW